MRTYLSALLLLAAIGCEHKSKSSEPPPANKPPPSQPPSAPQGQTPPTKTAEQPPAGQPPPSQDEVRPPVAADLAEYSKDLPGNGKMVATFETSMGAIHCELYPDKAPMTVANFVGLATGKKPWTNPKTGAVEKGKPYFDGLTFHRVIPEFMIQGGDPLGVGRGGPGYQFGDEFVAELRMQPGTLAMANAGPSTNGSQFFITEVAPDHLNGRHTIFGQCKEVDLVKQIARVAQDSSNKPDTPVRMNKVTVSKMQSW
ncbi:MAG: peptidylprolyl isomerase [Deltaproteobacteria bacterium]|nr:peptidylprolyl isomerase [Deltaproteobacteria bacterium]